MKGLDLSGFFTTNAQAKDFIDRLTIVGSDLYETSFDLEKNLQKSLGVKKKDKFITLLRENEVPMDSKQELGKFIEIIKKEISEMPTASLTVAIEPDNELLDSISNWFILNLKKQILVETVVDREIIGGVILNFQGKTYDTSIKQIFDKTIKGEYTEAIPSRENQQKQINPQRSN